MAMTKHTGVEEPLSKAHIVSKEDAEQAKRLSKQGSTSMIDAVVEAEDEDQDSNS